MQQFVNFFIHIRFSLQNDFGAEKWYRAGSSWLQVTPWGIREALKWATKTFTTETKGQPTFYITENGFSDLQGNLDDLQRIYYYKHYINQVCINTLLTRSLKFLLFDFQIIAKLVLQILFVIYSFFEQSKKMGLIFVDTTHGHF